MTQLPSTYCRYKLGLCFQYYSTDWVIGTDIPYDSCVPTNLVHVKCNATSVYLYFPFDVHHSNIEGKIESICFSRLLDRRNIPMAFAHAPMATKRCTFAFCILGCETDIGGYFQNLIKQLSKLIASWLQAPLQKIIILSFIYDKYFLGTDRSTDEIARTSYGVNILLFNPPYTWFLLWIRFLT